MSAVLVVFVERLEVCWKLLVVTVWQMQGADGGMCPVPPPRIVTTTTTTT